MECKVKGLRVLESLLLAFSVIFQIVCLATPGWQIKLDDSEVVGGTTRLRVDRYYGVFYLTECKHDLWEEGRAVCETKSWLEVHNKNILEQSSLTSDILEDNAYHIHVANQVILLVSLVLTIVCLVLQTYKVRHKDLETVLVTAVSICCQAFAGALTIGILCWYFIDINYNRNVDKRQQTDTVGFPYCVLMDTVAFLILLVKTVMDHINIRKVQRECFRHMQSVRYEDVVMSPCDNNTQAGTATDAQINTGMSYVRLEH